MAWNCLCGAGGQSKKKAPKYNKKPKKNKHHRPVISAPIIQVSLQWLFTAPLLWDKLVIRELISGGWQDGSCWKSKRELPLVLLNQNLQSKMGKKEAYSGSLKVITTQRGFPDVVSVYRSVDGPTWEASMGPSSVCERQSNKLRFYLSLFPRDFHLVL